MDYVNFSADNYSTKKECRDAAKSALRQARDHGLTEIRLTVSLDAMIAEIERLQVQWLETMAFSQESSETVYVPGVILPSGEIEVLASKYGDTRVSMDYLERGWACEGIDTALMRARGYMCRYDHPATIKGTACAINPQTREIHKFA